jgi:alkanesulfonate monooxygenase SsuD/methylene tetrahydromethanopterin reductase-like flavin-dependent oxidoreductase (luciferase family)
MDREHRELGFDLLDVDARFRRFEEALVVVTRLLREEGPVSFTGEFYALDGAEFVPNPVTQGVMPIVIGGNGLRRTLPLAARYADEWNGVNIPLSSYRERNLALDELARGEGRRPEDIRRTLMTRIIFGRDKGELETRLKGEDADALRAAGHVVGTPEEIPAQLLAMESAGVQGVMLQWLDGLDDIDGIAALGRAATTQS